MALFVDGPLTTIDDLRDQDSGLLAVAATCGINATTKIRLAHEEIESEVALWLKRPGPTLDLYHQPQARLEQVVFTNTLKRWETMLSLSLFYRDAYFSQLVDRYEGKWNEFSGLAREAHDGFVADGLGLVGSPLRRAALPSLGTAPGPQSGGTFYAAVAWVNAAGQEGQASDAASLAVPDNNLMTISATGNVPNAVGFNVYAGALVDAMFRQNSVPLPVGGTFTFVPGVTAANHLPGRGQAPDFVRPLARTILRG